MECTNALALNVSRKLCTCDANCLTTIVALYTNITKYVYVCRPGDPMLLG